MIFQKMHVNGSSWSCSLFSQEGLMPDATITFSVSGFLWFCGAICTVAAAIAVLYKAATKAQEPEKIQNERLDALERTVGKFESYFDRDKKRLDSLDEGNRVTQQALLALMSHAINGNDIDKLTKAKDDLESYLINKGGTTIS
jgi:hypothetical protein